MTALPALLDGSAGADSDALARALAAGERAEHLWRGMESGPVALLVGDEPLEVLRHYPSGDVYDLASHAQFYYHRHRDGEFGHIHLFQRPRGMPDGLRPVEPASEADAPSHLIAVGFGPGGNVCELFTTNRWVTGEAWYDAGSVKAMLAGLRLSVVGHRGPVADWLAALVAFYRPLIHVLMDERDRAVADWRLTRPGRDPLGDERLEITSRRDIDFAADLAWVRRKAGA